MPRPVRGFRGSVRQSRKFPQPAELRLPESPSPEPQDLILEDPGILEQLEQEEKEAMRPGQLWEMFSRDGPKYRHLTVPAAVRSLL